MTDQTPVEALAAFVAAAASVSEVCIDALDTEHAEALAAALADGGHITLTFGLSGLPCVVGYLTQPGKPVREAFRLEAQHRRLENSALH